MRTNRRPPITWAILIVVGSVLLLVAGFHWYSSTHGQVQVGAVVTTTTLPPELQGSATAATSASTAEQIPISVRLGTSPSSTATSSSSAAQSLVTKAVGPKRAAVTAGVSAEQPARPSVSAARKTVTSTVTATAAQSPGTGCVPAAVDIPFGSSNHPQGVSVNLIPHPLNADSSLWVPGPDTDIADWTDKAGWAKDNVRPGSGAGTVITIGHINYGGDEGAYSDLAEYLDSDVGKTFTVTCQSGETLTYRISGGLLTEKDELAADWRLPGQPLHHQLFDQQAAYGPPGQPSERFLLMSCGGLLDQAAHSYESNIFVYGVRIR